MLAEKNTMLNVNFADKDAVKSLGAKPHFENGKFLGWYVPIGMELAPFEKWLPVVGQGAEDKPYSLSGLLGLVKGAVQERVSAQYWVVAEILSVSNRKHVYLELAENSPEGGEVAKARASIWASRMTILHRFQKETGQSLVSGCKVMLKVGVEFHERFGLGLVVHDINSQFTVGEMEMKVKAIRDRLMAEGIYDRNVKCYPPVDFNRVAVIAPGQSAGVEDFKTVSSRLAAAGICEFHFYDASFQGANVVRDLTMAMQVIHQRREQVGGYDAIVIIRGGGDKAGLYQLNEYEIARAVCLSEIPVMVGVGHERDETILDEIAKIRCATPSMVAARIQGVIVENVNEALAAMAHLTENAKVMVSRAEQESELLVKGLTLDAKVQLAEIENKIELDYQNLMSRAEAQVTMAEQVTKELFAEVLQLDPGKVLSRGYAIVSNDQGKVLPDTAALAEGESIQITFRDGTRMATVGVA